MSLDDLFMNLVNDPLGLGLYSSKSYKRLVESDLLFKNRLAGVSIIPFWSCSFLVVGFQNS